MGSVSSNLVASSARGLPYLPQPVLVPIEEVVPFEWWIGALPMRRVEYVHHPEGNVAARAPIEDPDLAPERTVKDEPGGDRAAVVGEEQTAIGHEEAITVISGCITCVPEKGNRARKRALGSLRGRGEFPAGVPQRQVEVIELLPVSVVLHPPREGLSGPSRDDPEFAAPRRAARRISSVLRMKANRCRP